MRLLLLLAVPLSILLLHPEMAAGSVAPARLERWVRSGLQSLQWDQLDRCLRMSSLPEAECGRLTHLPPSSVAVYVSEPRTATGTEGRGHPNWGLCSFCTFQRYCRYASGWFLTFALCGNLTLSVTFQTKFWPSCRTHPSGW